MALLTNLLARRRRRAGSDDARHGTAAVSSRRPAPIEQALERTLGQLERLHPEDLRALTGATQQRIEDAIRASVAPWLGELERAGSRPLDAGLLKRVQADVAMHAVGPDWWPTVVFSAPPGVDAERWTATLGLPQDAPERSLQWFGERLGLSLLPLRVPPVPSYTQALTRHLAELELYQVRALDFGSVIPLPPRTVCRTGMTLREVSQMIRSGDIQGAGKGACLGILDTGVDLRHEAFGQALAEGRLVALDVFGGRYRQDTNGHGTHVAGIAAGAPADPQHVGVAPAASVVSVNVFGRQQFCSDEQVLDGASAAIEAGADILSLSLGAPGTPDCVLSFVLSEAARQGVVKAVIAAAGNDGAQSGGVGSPAVGEHVLAVAAVDAAGVLAPFSSRAAEGSPHYDSPNLAAPGCNVIAAKVGGGVIGLSGTSMATPVVSGQAARMLGAMRATGAEPDAAEFRRRLLACASNDNLRDLDGAVLRGPWNASTGGGLPLGDRVGKLARPRFGRLRAVNRSASRQANMGRPAVADRRAAASVPGEPEALRLSALVGALGLVCGQRGSGKSYTLGSLAEQAAVAGLPVVLGDRLGVYGCMGEPAKAGDRAAADLASAVRVFKAGTARRDATPATVHALTVAASELPVDVFADAIGIPSRAGGAQRALLELAIQTVQTGYAADGRNTPGRHAWGPADLSACIETADALRAPELAAASTRHAVLERLANATRGGLLARTGFSEAALSTPGRVAVLDLSDPDLDDDAMALVLGATMALLQLAKPQTVLLIDEAQDVLGGSDGAAFNHQLARFVAGGNRAIAATQQPSALCAAFRSRCDFVVAHKLVVAGDVDAVAGLFPTVAQPAAGPLALVLGALDVGEAVAARGDGSPPRKHKTEPRLLRHGGDAAKVGERVSRVPPRVCDPKAGGAALQLVVNGPAPDAPAPALQQSGAAMDQGWLVEPSLLIPPKAAAKCVVAGAGRWFFLGRRRNVEPALTDRRDALLWVLELTRRPPPSRWRWWPGATTRLQLAWLVDPGLLVAGATAAGLVWLAERSSSSPQAPSEAALQLSASVLQPGVIAALRPGRVQRPPPQRLAELLATRVGCEQPQWQPVPVHWPLWDVRAAAGGPVVVVDAVSGRPLPAVAEPGARDAWDVASAGARR